MSPPKRPVSYMVYETTFAYFHFIFAPRHIYRLPLPLGQFDDFEKLPIAAESARQEGSCPPLFLHGPHVKLTRQINCEVELGGDWIGRRGRDAAIRIESCGFSASFLSFSLVVPLPSSPGFRFLKQISSNDPTIIGKREEKNNFKYASMLVFWEEKVGTHLHFI